MFLVWHWLYRFSRDVLFDIARLLSSAEAIPPSELQRVDQRLRAFPLHPRTSCSRSHVPSEDYPLPGSSTDRNTRLRGNPAMSLYAKALGKHYLLTSKIAFILPTYSCSLSPPAILRSSHAGIKASI